MVSALGGALTLGSYLMFFDKTDNSIVSNSEMPIAIPVNYNTNIAAAAENTDFTVIADKTVHAVVHVKNVSISPSNSNPLSQFFYGNSDTETQRVVGTGSGVIISEDGYIITNNHVVKGARKIEITLNNKETYKAEIVGVDESSDIALLKIDKGNLPYLPFGNSDYLKVGEWVLAVGNPFNLTSTVTAGIISAKSRDLSGGNTQSFIQTDAAVNPGNSGGALVNIDGDLIGINTAITSQTGNYVGYSFAVPSNIAKKVVEDIMEFGNVQNGILGIIGSTLNSEFAEDIGVNETEGFYINEVSKDSGADRAGLKPGDIIKQLDDIKISKFSDLKGFLNTKSPNDIVNVKVLRDGKEKTMAVTLLRNETIVVPVLGLLRNASKEELKKHKTNHGVKISSLTQNKYFNSYWKKNGIQEGNIVTAINNKKINSIEDVEKIISNLSTNEPLRIELINSKGEKERFNFK